MLYFSELEDRAPKYVRRGAGTFILEAQTLAETFPDPFEALAAAVLMRALQDVHRPPSAREQQDAEHGENQGVKFHSQSIARKTR